MAWLRGDKIHLRPKTKLNLLRNLYPRLPHAQIHYKALIPHQLMPWDVANMHVSYQCMCMTSNKE